MIIKHLNSSLYMSAKNNEIEIFKMLISIDNDFSVLKGTILESFMQSLNQTKRKGSRSFKSNFECNFSFDIINYIYNYDKEHAKNN